MIRHYVLHYTMAGNISVPFVEVGAPAVLQYCSEGVHVDLEHVKELDLQCTYVMHGVHSVRHIRCMRNVVYMKKYALL